MARVRSGRRLVGEPSAVSHRPSARHSRRRSDHAPGLATPDGGTGRRAPLRGGGAGRARRGARAVYGNGGAPGDCDIRRIGLPPSPSPPHHPPPLPPPLSPPPPPLPHPARP